MIKQEVARLLEQHLDNKLSAQALAELIDIMYSVVKDKQEEPKITQYKTTEELLNSLLNGYRKG
jgi:hypothetical protein